ncbi:MAG: hypothetical protein ACREEM_56330 [Blastocatellia bacterium]
MSGLDRQFGTALDHTHSLKHREDTHREIALDNLCWSKQSQYADDLAETSAPVPADPLLKSARARGINVPRPIAVRDYLSGHSDVIGLTGGFYVTADFRNSEGR